MTNLNELLKRILKEKVNFVLIGGFAGVAHGASQVTQDLDICISINKNQIQKLRKALQDLHPVHRMNPNFKPSFLDYPKNAEKLNNIYLQTDIGILDILTEVSPIGDFKKVKKNAKKIKLFGYPCFIISLNDLIEIKKHLKRAKDKALYKELLEIKKKRT